MGNSLRCCLSCVLPCGSLDLIRIIHLNGTVEEITHSVTAGDIIKDRYPNHVLAKPFRRPSQQAGREIVLLSPHSELKRGAVYFLIPAPAHKSSRSASDSINIKINNKSKSRDLQDNHRRKKSVVEWHPYLDSILEEY